MPSEICQPLFPDTLKYSFMNEKVQEIGLMALGGADASP